MRKLTYIFIGVVSVVLFRSVDAAEPASQNSFLCEVTVACGPSVRIDGNKVILDRNLIYKFSKQPTLDLLEKNLWEIIYFVNIFDKQAMSGAIDLIATIDPKRVRSIEHTGVRLLARSLTQHTQFWDLLGGKPLPIRRKVIQYFDKYKTDYTLGYDYEEWKQKILKP